jgi:hypothetical protein
VAFPPRVNRLVNSTFLGIEVTKNVNFLGRPACRIAGNAAFPGQNKIGTSIAYISANGHIVCSGHQINP